MRYLEFKRLLGSVALALSLAVSGVALPAGAAAQEPAQPGVIEESEEVEQGMRGMQRGESRGGSGLGWLGLLGLVGLLGLRGRQHAARVDTATTRRAA